MKPENIFTFAIENGRLLFPVLFALSLAFFLLVWQRRQSRVARFSLAPLALAVLVTAGGFVFAHRALAAIDERTQSLTFYRLDQTAPEQRGPAEKVADLRGQVIVLNYWATWCPPCRAEMPDLSRLAASYADRGVVVVTVSDEKSEVIEKYRATQPLETVVATFDDNTPPTDAIGRFAYAGRPTTVVIDRQGKVRRLLIGGRSYQQFEQAITPLL